jgi:short subunit dehydrogenase-like uncharacterized protein
MSKKIAVYGSYGLTGSLVVNELLARGHEPVLCGRNPVALGNLKDLLGRRLRTVAANIDDPSSLDRMLDGAFAVLNCAGPYTNTSIPLASAAIRNRVHYLDPNAVEQMAAKRLFDELDAPAKAAQVTIVPVMGILGGLGDVLADVATRGKSDVEEVTIAYLINGWIPTRGSQLTSKLQRPAKRLAFEGGAFAEVESSQVIEEFDFGHKIGRKKVLARYPGSEIATLPRHVSAQRVAVKMALSTIQEFGAADPQWAAAVDSETRSKTTFSTIVEVKAAEGVTRLTTSGRDIYGITAPFMVNGLERLQESGAGVLSPSDAFGGRHLLDALRSHGFTHDFSPAPEAA